MQGLHGFVVVVAEIMATGPTVFPPPFPPTNMGLQHPSGFRETTDVFKPNGAYDICVKEQSPLPYLFHPLEYSQYFPTFYDQPRFKRKSL
jgi:hypothetical protein